MGQVLLILISAFSLFVQQPAEATARFNHAVELQQQGKFQEAADEYRALLKLKPDYAEAQANLGVVLTRLGQYDAAAESYEAALRVNPQLIPVLLNLGILHYRAARFEKAIETLENFLRSYPNHTQAQQLVGLSLVELGRDAEAIARLQPLSTTSVDPAALYSLGLAYLRTDNPHLTAVIEQLALLPEGRAAAHLLRGQGFIKRFEFEKAIAELSEAQKLNAELPRLNYSLGLCHFKLSRNREGIAAFEKELKYRPRDSASHFYLASLHEAEAEYEPALRYLREVLNALPDSADANALLGKILVKQNKAAEALKPLEIAVAKDTTDPDKRYLLARVYQQLGKRAEASREFAEVQRLKAQKLRQDRDNTPKP